MQIVKGMIQVAGATYRIERVRPNQYTAIRIKDDVPVGAFTSFPRLEVTSYLIELTAMREIARAAVFGGKTSWVNRLTH